MSETSVRRGYCPACQVVHHWRGSLPASHGACRTCMTNLERPSKRSLGTHDEMLPVARLRPVLRLTVVSIKAEQ